MNNYQLRVTLMDIKPPIWRRIVVPGTISLAKLHNIIQTSMGWENYHIYLFTVGRQRYGEGVREWAECDQKVFNAKHVMLQDVAGRKGARFVYEYDMGDGWAHQVVVEDIEEGIPSRVRCLDGARSCPPEDCGGPFGYEELLEIVFDPKHPEYEDRKAWLGGGFNPEAFVRGAVNRKLGRLKVGSQAA